MKDLFYLFVLAIIFSINLAIADVHVSVGETAIQVTGKSQIDQTKGNLTSTISPNLGLLLLAEFNPKLKLNFFGEVTRLKFQEPNGRNIKDDQVTLFKYSTGLILLISKNKELHLDFGFQDFPSYYNHDQSQVVITKSNGFLFNMSYSHLLESLFNCTYQLSLQAISPLKSDLDQGKLGYGYEVLIEKEIKKDSISYNIDGFYGRQQFPMKNISLKKDELGVKFLIKIPIKSKHIL